MDQRRWIIVRRLMSRTYRKAPSSANLGIISLHTDHFKRDQLLVTVCAGCYQPGFRTFPVRGLVI